MASKKPNNNLTPSKSLRARAEELLRATPADMPTADVQALVHELNVHQIELEIQNEELRQAQLELARSRDRYADLYDFAPVGYVTLNTDGKILEANLTAATLLGVERKRLVGANVSNWLDHGAQDDCCLHRQAVFSSDAKQMCEVEMHRADGTSLSVRLESIAFGVDHERQCRTALIDVTTVKDARQQLEESEQRYRRLTDAVTDYVYRVRVDDGHAVETIHGANCEAVTGYTPDGFRANPLLWIAMVPTEDRGIVEQQVTRILSDQDAPPIEHRIQRKDGQIRWVLNTVSPQHDERGHLIAYDGLLRDVTERKEAETAVRELNETLEQRVAEQTREVRLLAEAMANLGEGVMITTDHFTWPGPQIVYVNETMCRITGYTAEELIGQTPRLLQGAKTDKDTIKQLRRALSEKRPHLCELVNYRKDGTPYDAELFISPLYDADGNHTNFISIHRDITQRKQADAALRDSQERFSSFMNNSPALAWMKDEHGHYVYLSKTYEERFGVRFEDWRGKTDHELWPSEFANELRSHDREVLSSGTAKDFEERTSNPDGTLCYWWSFRFPFKDSSGVRFVGGVAVDITERKRAADMLRDNEERMRAILNTAADAIITIDRRGIIDSINSAAERMFGYPQYELVGQNVSLLMPLPYCDERDGYIARYLETGEARIIGTGREVTGQRKDGSTFPADLGVSEVKRLSLFTGIIRDISERKKLQRDVLRIAEDEQRRIGQDLHDSTQQELAGLGMLAQTLLENLSAESAGLKHARASGIHELAAKIVNGIARTHQEVQAISRGLVPVGLDTKGLMDALHELASRTDDLEGVNCAFKCEQPVEVADSLTATHLYRIAQEAVTNALKHSQPEHILIALEADEGQTILQVADDGAGFDAGQQTEGLGLKTMHYRASLIGASLTIQPVQAGGTLVTCRVSGGGNLR